MFTKQQEIGIALNYVEITEREMRYAYDEMLDNCYSEVQIANFHYSTSRALKEVDPTAYEVGFNDFISSELEDHLYEISNKYYCQDDVNEFLESEEEASEEIERTEFL